jgi:hypothetical protein
MNVYLLKGLKLIIKEGREGIACHYNDRKDDQANYDQCLSCIDCRTRNSSYLEIGHQIFSNTPEEGCAG